MNILFLANLVPFPLDGGGKIFTYSVIKGLSSKHNVDLLCFYENEDIVKAKEELLKVCNSITLLPIKVTTKENKKLMMFKAIKSLFSLKPLCIEKYTIDDMKNNILSKISEKKYDVIFFNILAMYTYAPLVKRIDSSIKTVLYEQNCEALIYERYFKQTKNLFKKAFLFLESRKLRKFEKDAISTVDQLILLSDADRLALGVKKDDCNIIPIGVQPASYSKEYNNDITKKSINMLFVGTMTWEPNNDGIIWFLEKVMPIYRDLKEYELYIVGKNPSDTVKNLASKYKNVHLMGYVGSVDEYYDKCDVLIVPLFIGSGQRVKIIEAFSRGYAVVSTSIGAEGLAYENENNILIANTQQEFEMQINRCFNGELLKRIGNNSKKLFEEEYSTAIITEKLNMVLEK